MKDKLFAFFSKKLVPIISTILFILFMILVLPYINRLMQDNLGQLSSPDTMLFYSAETFYSLLLAYGEAGRSLYILLRWTFDLIYPIIYGLFFLSVLTQLMLHNHKINKTILWIPLLAVVFDLLENTIATILMVNFPVRYNALVYILQIASALKWLMLLITIILIAYYLILRINQYIASKREIRIASKTKNKTEE
ncbi:MAG: hypothetical protein ACOCUD_03535 [Bacillota bacterium]